MKFFRGSPLGGTDVSIWQRDIRTPGFCVFDHTPFSLAFTLGVTLRLTLPVMHRCTTRREIVTRYRSATVAGFHGLPCICKMDQTAHHSLGWIKITSLINNDAVLAVSCHAAVMQGRCWLQALPFSI